MYEQGYEQLKLPEEFPVIFHRDILRRDDNFIVHWHESPELLYFREGRACVDSDTRHFSAEPETLVAVNPGRLHSVHCLSDTCRYDCLILGKPFLTDFGLPVDEREIFPLAGDAAVQESFDTVSREMGERTEGYRQAVKAEVLRLTTRLYRVSSGPPAQTDEAARRRLDMVRASILYIREHCAEPLTVNDICRHAGFSKYYFCRVFHEITGKTVMDTVNYFRCRRARELLAAGRCNVSESADRCGFRNLSYFSRVYARQMGELPSQTARLP